MRIEVLDEWFFPLAEAVGGNRTPASPEARKKVNELKAWSASIPRDWPEKPRISMGPRTRDGKIIISVRQEDVYK